MKTRSGALLVCMLLGAPVAAGEERTGVAASQISPLPTWTGLYAGLNAGSLWTNPTASVDWSRLTAPGDFSYPSAFASLPRSGFAWSNGPGFAGGGQVGYNWRISDKVVVGLETDFQGIAGGGTNIGGLPALSSIRGPSAVGSVRGRAGYLVTPNLQLYGTGGFSYGAGN